MVSTRGLAWLVLLLLCDSHGPRGGLCQDATGQGYDGDEEGTAYDDDDYLEEEGGTTCHPEEADSCFAPLTENLLCHLVTPIGRNCTLRDALDFCLSLKDALACCGDIIDSSCSEEEGRGVFDTWLVGLQAVHRHLCFSEDHFDLINELLDSSRCWRAKRFLLCVEDQANLTHVSDLLTTHLDILACNRLQMAIGSCNSGAERNNKRCRGKSQVVFEALISFFSATACGFNDTRPPASGKSEPPRDVIPPPAPCSLRAAQGGGGSLVAVVVTMVVTVVAVAVVAVVLGRRGALTLHLSKIRHPARSGGDDQAVYSNF